MCKGIDRLLKEVLTDIIENDIPLPSEEEKAKEFEKLITRLQRQRRKERIWWLMFGFISGVITACALFFIIYVYRGS